MHDIGQNVIMMCDSGLRPQVIRHGKAYLLIIQMDYKQAVKRFGIGLLLVVISKKIPTRHQTAQNLLLFLKL